MVLMGGVGARVERLAIRLPLLAAALALAASGCAVTSPSSGGGGDDTGTRDGDRPHAIAGEHRGTLPNGTTWLARVPEDWNGVFLLYAHGYIPGFVPGPPVAQVAPTGPTETALLDRGYALAGSSYVANGWVMATAAADQIATLDAALEASEAEPDMVLAYGSSMGGLVTGQIAEVADGVVDGAMPTCGLMHGGVGLVNYQLDGAHAINELLDPGADIKLVGYSGYPEAHAASGALTAAIEAGQQSPQGRARVALAAALFHMPHEETGRPEPAPGDWAAIQEAQFRWLRTTLAFVTPGRFDIESQVGGNASSNVGVDYRHLFQRSADREQVEALYAQAGLDLHGDLARLTATADVDADPAALGRLEETSTLSGDLGMEVLTLHTTSDNLAPVQVERAYRKQVRRMGATPQFRQAFVDRPGHCSFSPAEIVASIQALERTVACGSWADRADPAVLDAAAERLGLGESNIVEFTHGKFLGTRTPY
jgi:hypothetical protein